jgi:nucleotide-binding universal stress UspA family protein
MLRSILVGLDGSPFSASAVELGIGWAKRSGATLVGLGIVDEPTILEPEAVPLGGGAFKEHRDEYLLADARRKVEQLLGELSQRCASAGVACKVLENVGLPSEQILLEAQRYDLILLGQKTFFHFETQLGPDETLHKVLKGSPRPVVAAPEKLDGGTSVVVAYDGSLQAARTLQAFQTLLADRTQEIHVVSAHPEAELAQQHAARAVEFLGFHGITAQCHALVTHAAPAQVILEQVKLLNAGLLVMGAYGHSALREFFFGSVTRNLLKGSTVPLFLYH